MLRSTYSAHSLHSLLQLCWQSPSKLSPPRQHQSRSASPFPRVTGPCCLPNRRHRSTRSRARLHEPSRPPDYRTAPLSSWSLSASRLTATTNSARSTPTSSLATAKASARGQDIWLFLPCHISTPPSRSTSSSTPPPPSTAETASASTASTPTTIGRTACYCSVG